MKNKIKTVFGLILTCVIAGFISCQDMLEIRSNSYLETEGNLFDTPNDSLYSVVGILKQLQQLGDRYVVLGELRGDLMAVTENADMDLQAIADFSATADNPYLSTRDYYAVINNCNYFLQRVDTNVVSGGKKVLKGEYAVVKAIRDWTYLQLALNYGKVTYITDPILTLDDMNKNYPVLQQQELIETLLADISEYIDDTIYPNYGGGLHPMLFISGPMLAGDLLLWMGAHTGNQSYYEMAARIYYSYILNNQYCMGAGTFRNTYFNSEFDILGLDRWNSFPGAVGEMISMISNSISSSETLDWPRLTLLTFPQVSGRDFEYKLRPSQAAMDLWKNETYVHYNATTGALFYNKGDLRGECHHASSSVALGSYYHYTAGGDSLPTIAKFGYLVAISGSSFSDNVKPFVNPYRIGQMYLRYAEALNGLGKPSLAFAVLKHGLSGDVMYDSRKINPEEITPMPPYCDFTDFRFSVLAGSQPQTGIHMRGSGYANQDTLYYSFKEETLQSNSAYYGFPAALATKQDSIQFVDAMIFKELALETAFEGNRFHDLMRFAVRRNDNAFLANWVGRRNPALTAPLMNRDKWYLPWSD